MWIDKHILGIYNSLQIGNKSKNAFEGALQSFCRALSLEIKRALCPSKRREDMDTRNALSVLKNSVKKQWLFGMVLAVLAALSLIFMTGFAMFTNRVYVTDGSDVKCILTTESDISKILEDNGYAIGNDDVVKFDGFKDHEGEATILRAFGVDVTCDGSTKEIMIAEGTVADVLAKAGISVGDDDLVNIGFSEKVDDDTKIVIQRVTYEETTSETEIPFETKQIFSANLARGTQVVNCEGEVGTLQTVSRNTYIDGVLTKTEILSQVVTKTPVDRVVTVGSSLRTPVSTNAPEWLQLDANGAPTSYKKVLTGKSAAYSAPAGARTSTGKVAKIGYVAVNPNIIPYGSKLYIVSTDGKYVYGYAVAADTGTALMDGRILVDLFFDSYSASCKWGIKQVNIYILE